MEIIKCMMIDPYFALLAIGQFISYAGFIFVCGYVCRRLIKVR